MKPKTCKQCGKMFEPRLALQVVCSGTCGIQRSREQRLEKARESRRKEELPQTTRRTKRKRTYSDWLQVAQAAVNAFVRARDEGEGKPCISCGRMKPLEAGHWRSRAAYPELRFDTRNIEGQCAGCNRGQVRYRRSGTVQQAFTAGMLERYGQARVDWCFGPHELKKYSKEDLERMARIFRKRARIYKKLRDG